MSSSTRNHAYAAVRLLAVPAAASALEYGGGAQRVRSLLTSLAPYTNPTYPELLDGRHEA
ncbi:MAG: hypothetical protein ABIQ10_15540 [Gemmatimonadaceae bacterium]